MHPLHPKALRARAEVINDSVQDLDFLPLCELAREGYRWEELLNACLDPDARLERSVERCWWNYARTVLHLQDHVRRKYTRRGPSGRRVRSWAYPIERPPPSGASWQRSTSPRSFRTISVIVLGGSPNNNRSGLRTFGYSHRARWHNPNVQHPHLLSRVPHMMVSGWKDSPEPFIYPSRSASCLNEYLTQCV
jgi:hypothetical protein